jgi:hypothetical protein
LTLSTTILRTAATFATTIKDRSLGCCERDKLVIEGELQQGRNLRRRHKCIDRSSHFLHPSTKTSAQHINSTPQLKNTIPSLPTCTSSRPSA